MEIYLLCKNIIFKLLKCIKGYDWIVPIDILFLRCNVVVFNGSSRYNDSVQLQMTFIQIRKKLVFSFGNRLWIIISLWIQTLDFFDLMMMAASFFTATDVTTGIVGNNVDRGLLIKHGNETTETDIRIVPNDIVVWLVNEKLSSINQPCIIYLVICVILGMFGNSLVLYIHGKAPKRNVAAFFIMCLAIFDILSCIGLIFEIFDRRFPMYSGNLPILCKAVRYFEVCANGCSVGALLCISIDRYYKICKPLKSFSIKKAKLTLVTVSLISVIVSSPSLLFYGSETIELGNRYAKGHDCADDDLYKHTIYPSVFYLTFFVCMLTSFLIIIIMYICVFVAIRKWKRGHIGEFISETPTTNNIRFEYNGAVIDATRGMSTNVPSDITSGNNADLIVIRQDRHSMNSKEFKQKRNKKNAISCNSNIQTGPPRTRSRYHQSNRPPTSPRQFIRSHMSLKTRAKVSRMTVVFSIVTLVFILSYFPYFIIEILNALGSLKEDDLALPVRQLVVISNASYSLNYIANPIIYSFMNPVFRTGIKTLLFGKETRTDTIQSFEKLRTTLSNIRHIWWP